MTMRMLLGAICLALLVPAAAGAASPGDPADLLAKVDARYRRVEALRSAFVQRERVAALGVTREYRGTVTFRRPGRMRWDYGSGPLRTAVADGTHLWLHYPEEGTVHRLSFGPAELARSPVAVLFDRSASLGEVFEAVSAAPRDDGLVRLELRPRQGPAEGGSVAFLVRPSDGTVAGTIVADAYGNVTEMSLEGAVEGGRPDDALFVFQVPAGARVVER